MTSEQKPREFLEYPMVIDWLQWSDEFKEELGKPDMAQVTLTLIAEGKAKIIKQEKQITALKEALMKSKSEWEVLHPKEYKELVAWQMAKVALQKAEK